MKAPKTALYVLMLLPLAVTAIALFFLPDQIPAHYNTVGLVDRWGSKFESLIIPATNLLFGFFFLGMARLASKGEKSGQNNERACIICALCCLIVFNAMDYFFLYTSFRRVESLSSVPLDLYQVIFGVLGIAMIVVGNIMPKLRMNGLIGLRTGWSMKNEITWKKSQLFGGVSFIVGGILIVVLCLLTKGAACMIWSVAILILLTIIDVYYTYRIAQKY